MSLAVLCSGASLALSFLLLCYMFLFGSRRGGCFCVLLLHCFIGLCCVAAQSLKHLRQRRIQVLTCKMLIKEPKPTKGRGGFIEISNSCSQRYAQKERDIEIEIERQNCQRMKSRTRTTQSLLGPCGQLEETHTKTSKIWVSRGIPQCR